MEYSSVEETQKVESQVEEEKEVIVAEIKSAVESGEEVAAAADDKSGSAIETQVSEAIIENITTSDEQVTQTEETTELLVSENVEETIEASEVVVESAELTESSAKEVGDGTEAPAENPLASENVEIPSKENPEEELVSPEETTPVVTDEAVKGPLDESTAEPRGETEAVETIKDLASGEESKPPSLEDIAGSSLRQTEPSSLTSDESKVVPPPITGAVPEKIEEEELPISDVKTGESLVIHEASKENVPAAETTSTTVKDRDENPAVASTTRRQHDSCNSCCGLLELLIGVNR